jgi:hypothetical protein
MPILRREMLDVLLLSSGYAMERREIYRRVRDGEYEGVVRSPKRVFQRLLDRSPMPERCLEAYHLHRTRLERIAAARKVRRRQLTDDANIEITGRDLRERKQRAPAGQTPFEWAAR